jgi:hypothetical protein
VEPHIGKSSNAESVNGQPFPGGWFWLGAE